LLKLVLVSPDKKSLSGLSSALAAHSDVELFWANSGKTALDIASGAAVDLVVTDEGLGDMTGLELAGKLLSVNPMINYASVSRLSPEEFHEASEGLGVLAQLPIKPSKEHAEELVQRLKYIKNLST